MKIKVSKNELLKNLQSVGGVIQMGHTMPIMENFLFEIFKDLLKITASDLETTLSLEMNIESTEAGAYAVQSRIILDVLKNLPEQPLTFEFLENKTVEIISTTGNYVLPYSDATEYPKAIVIEKPTTINLPSNVLARAVSKTIFAASNDDLRPLLTGIFFQFTNKGITFVATDAFKLVRYSRQDIKTNITSCFTVPKKPMNILKGILAGTDAEVTIEHGVGNVKFSFGNTEMVCRLIDGKYPNYEAVIPKENPNHFIIDRIQFLNAVSCVSIFSDRQTHQVRLKITGNELIISAEDTDYSNKAEERLTCNYNGKDIYIGFNARSLTEMLKNLQSKDVNIEMSLPDRPGILTPVDGLEKGEEILMLITPSLISK